jgi:hypothetical protein
MLHHHHQDRFFVTAVQADRRALADTRRSAAAHALRPPDALDRPRGRARGVTRRRQRWGMRSLVTASSRSSANASVLRVRT